MNAMRDLSTIQAYELNDDYVNRIKETIDMAVEAYGRVFAFRVDLRYPSDMDSYHRGLMDVPGFTLPRSSSAISRFTASFKEQIKHDLYRKEIEGKRVYPCQPRYIWCKEQNIAETPHFHVLILLNKDAYFSLGNYSSTGSMAYRVIKAWASALTLSEIEYASRLVHFPDNPTYYIDRNSLEFKRQFDSVMYRASYFAKTATKHYGDRQHNFGASIR